MAKPSQVALTVAVQHIRSSSQNSGIALCQSLAIPCLLHIVKVDSRVFESKRALSSRCETTLCSDLMAILVEENGNGQEKYT